MFINNCLLRIEIVTETTTRMSFRTYTKYRRKQYSKLRPYCITRQFKYKGNNNFFTHVLPLPCQIVRHSTVYYRHYCRLNCILDSVNKRDFCAFLYYTNTKELKIPSSTSDCLQCIKWHYLHHITDYIYELLLLVIFRGNSSSPQYGTTRNYFYNVKRWMYRRVFTDMTKT